MTYRTAPIEPLILIGTAGVQALSPADGSLLWQVRFSDHEISTGSFSRVARTGDHLVFCNGEGVVFFDVHTGEIRARYSLTFSVRSLVANGANVVAAGIDGVACFHDTLLAWRVEKSAEKQPDAGWLSLGTTVYDLYDGTGRRLRRLDFWPLTVSTSDIALVLGATVAQADHNT